MGNLGILDGSRAGTEKPASTAFSRATSAPLPSRMPRLPITTPGARPGPMRSRIRPRLTRPSGRAALIRASIRALAQCGITSARPLAARPSTKKAAITTSPSSASHRPRSSARTGGAGPPRRVLTARAPPAARSADPFSASWFIGFGCFRPDPRPLRDDPLYLCRFRRKTEPQFNRTGGPP